MSHHDETLKRLERLARQAPRPEEPPMPFGFDARVVAVRRAAEPAPVLWERLAWRALPAVATLTIACVLASRYLGPPPSPDEFAIANAMFKESLMP